MRTYLAIMAVGLRSVLDFRGRSVRAAYWPYVLSLLVLLTVLGQILAVRAILATGMAGIGYLFTSFESPSAWFGVLFLNNILYLGCVGWLIVMLAKPGDVGSNRYGDPAQTLQ